MPGFQRSVLRLAGLLDHRLRRSRNGFGVDLRGLRTEVAAAFTFERAAFVCSMARFVGAERLTFFTSFSPRFERSVNVFVARLRALLVALSTRVVADFAASVMLFSVSVGSDVALLGNSVAVERIWVGRAVTRFGRVFTRSRAMSPAPTAAYIAFLVVLMSSHPPPGEIDEVEAEGRRGAG